MPVCPRPTWLPAKRMTASPQLPSGPLAHIHRNHNLPHVPKILRQAAGFVVGLGVSVSGHFNMSFITVLIGIRQAGWLCVGPGHQCVACPLNIFASPSIFESST